MKKSVFTKLLAINISMIILIHVIIGIFLSLKYRSYIYDKIKSDANIYSKFIYKIYTDDNRLNVENIVKELNLDIILFDDKGSTNMDMMKYSSYPRNVEPTFYLDNKYIEELKIYGIVEFQGYYFDGTKGDVYSIIVPVVENSKIKLIVNINNSLSTINNGIMRIYIITIVLGLISIISISVILFFLSRNVIIKPLNKFNDVLYKIAQGEVDKRVEIENNDEFGDLANSLNKMADAIENVERNRREFISNVSHELRSPITSINGFIVGIIDGVIPENRIKYYLNIANNEIKRLIRLINDLLDLSAIDNQSSLEVEKMDIIELIKQSVEKFIPKIYENDLLLDLQFEESKLIVITNKDKIIQVLTNLIDNAVKYSKDGGKLAIIAKTKGTKVLISVYNEGHIPDESLNMLWDRFYKIDKSRTSKESTGLGLSIVRAILLRLGEDVWAENVGNNAVAFTFTLQKSN